MTGSLKRLLLATALSAGFALPVAAQSLSGAYLAARQASFVGDLAAAAQYYSSAIIADPSNNYIKERGVLAYLSLGKVDQADTIAKQLEDAGESSQLANMAQIVYLSRNQAYSDVLDRLDQNKGIGPLVDGLLRGWAQLGQGDMSSALVAFDVLSEERGLKGFALYHKALALASVGDYEGAELLFGAEGPGAVQMTRRGIMARAQVLSQLDKFDVAVESIDSAFGERLDPGLIDMRAALVAKEKLPFDHITGPRDGIAEVFYTLAGALSSEANDDYTLLYSRMADYIRPEHIDAILLSAELLEKMEQYDLAVQTYQRVPRDDPSYHAAELGRAAALRDSGKEELAVEVLEQLAETHGDLAIVQSTLGDTMRQLERYEEAIAAYDAALATFSEPSRSQWFLHYARAICYERIDNWESSESDFRMALELNPEQPQVLNYLGYSLVEKNTKLDEALDMIERAVAARPDSGYIIDSLGWVLYRLGRYDEAVPHMERASELMAIDPVVNDHLGDVYWAVGRKLEAEFQWKRALSFIGHEEVSDEADPDRIRRKLEIGLDAVLKEEGAPALKMVNDSN